MFPVDETSSYDVEVTDLKNGTILITSSGTAGSVTRKLEVNVEPVS